MSCKELEEYFKKTDKGCDNFLRNGQELNYSDLKEDALQTTSDLFAENQINLSGTDIIYHKLAPRKMQKIDPLYGEYINIKYLTPIKIKGIFKYPLDAYLSRAEGVQKTFTTSCSVTRKAFEDYGIPYPTEGDVIEVWLTDFWINKGNLDRQSPGESFAFLVKKSSPKGMIGASPSFTGFDLTVTRYTEYTPERFAERR